MIPKNFVAGHLHEHVEKWEEILDKDSPSYLQVKDWITNGVDIPSYFKHFKGKFWGNDYDQASPPQMRGCAVGVVVINLYE